MPRPNILLIQTDSHDGRAMGCAGHPAMARATPNLDRLAERGVRFGNAYTNNPVCCPCRASLWSGTYTHVCEGWNNYKGLEPDDPTFVTHLERAGYQTRIVGRTDHLSGQHTSRARVTAWTRSACIARPAYRGFPPAVRPTDEERVHPGDWANAEKAVATLEELAANPDQPFLCYFGTGLPHPKFETSRQWYDLVDGDAIRIPPHDAALAEHPVWRQRLTQMPWEYGFSEAMVRQVRRVYYAMCAEVDAAIGLALDALDRTGLADNTVVILTSDHGEMALEHDTWYKMCMHEGAARVPMIVAGPGVQRGAVVDNLVSLIDVFPTLMDIAGLAKPGHCNGHSLMPMSAGQPGGRPDWVLSEFHDTPMPTGLFMLRRADWKYIANVGYAPHLFHLGSDPDELHDLAGTRPDVIADMDTKLREIVDYEAVDAKVKAYDRESFARWRDEQRAAGTYEAEMSRIHSGFDGITDEQVIPWSAADEARIATWLGGAEPGRG
jgi:arylsulfatase K